MAHSIYLIIFFPYVKHQESFTRYGDRKSNKEKDIAIFIYGFSKTDKDNLNKEELLISFE